MFMQSLHWNGRVSLCALPFQTVKCATLRDPEFLFAKER